MTSRIRWAVVAGFAAAALIGYAAWDGGRALAQVDAPAPVRIATVDLYAIVEKLMTGPEIQKAQEDLKAKWEPRIEKIQEDFRRLESDLQTLPQSDPRFQDVLRLGRDKQAEYEQAAADRQEEYESLSSTQLVEAYTRAREAAGRVSDRMGYTHTFVNRPPDRPIVTPTLGNTLQEFLARPIIKAPPGDEITKAVAAELKIEL